MRTDGDITYFLIQHRLPGEQRWADSSLEAMLFGNMSYEDRIGELGERRRALLAPQGAGSNLWQDFGIHGFERAFDAAAVLDELLLRELRSTRGGRDKTVEFRLAKRSIKQETEPVIGRQFSYEQLVDIVDRVVCEYPPRMDAPLLRESIEKAIIATAHDRIREAAK